MSHHRSALLLIVAMLITMSPHRSAVAQSGTREATPGAVSRLAFIAPENDFVTDRLIIMDSNGKNPADLVRGAYSLNDIVFSPDGRSIVYGAESDGNTLKQDLYIVAANGGTPRLLSSAAAYYDGVASWSPDSKQLVYGSERDAKNGGPGIFIINADGSGEHRLKIEDKTLGLVSYNSDPTWMPDGKRILFHASRIIDNQVNSFPFTVNSDGTNVMPFMEAATQYQISGIRFSPDGRHLVFSAYQDEATYWQNGYRHEQLFTADADGSNIVALTKPNAVPIISGAIWSPDSKQIAFLGRDPDPKKYQVNPYFINTDGSGMHAVQLPDDKDNTSQTEAYFVSGFGNNLTWAAVPADLAGSVTEPAAPPTATLDIPPSDTPVPSKTPKPSASPRPSRTPKPSATPKA